MGQGEEKPNSASVVNERNMRDAKAQNSARSGQMPPAASSRMEDKAPQQAGGAARGTSSRYAPPLAEQNAPEQYAPEQYAPGPPVAGPREVSPGSKTCVDLKRNLRAVTPLAKACMADEEILEALELQQGVHSGAIIVASLVGIGMAFALGCCVGAQCAATRGAAAGDGGSLYGRESSRY